MKENDFYKWVIENFKPYNETHWIGKDMEQPYTLDALKEWYEDELEQEKIKKEAYLNLFEYCRKLNKQKKECEHPLRSLTFYNDDTVSCSKCGGEDIEIHPELNN